MKSYDITGGHVSNKTTTIRIVIGSWLLLTLVLVNVYNGTFISYVTSINHAQPLINSVEDVATDSKIRLVVDKGLAADTVFSVLWITYSSLPFKIVRNFKTCAFKW